ncbi:MAG: M15 family metallopeptidase [Erysipelotrichaceae bacterium]|nr:M15 family metallopeptidase [Erysipelotrichaceae bacterium]MDY5251175.1 M15 family metallopeptidase [Erysipelotrichaceae bacterium]
MYKLLGLLITILLILLGTGIFFRLTKDEPATTDALETIEVSNEPEVSASASPDAATNDQPGEETITTSEPALTYDTTSYDSITVIANKKHSIDTYEPSDLTAVSHSGSNGTQYMRQEAASALEELFAKADEDGIALYAQSGYRSYQTQQGLYQSYANRDGVAAADTYSSRAGHSDHQTGLAMDIMGDNTRMNASDRSDCPIEQCEGSPAALWLADNAADFGFILRFPPGKQDVTGYVYEWWHYRYVGKDLAPKIMDSGLTMEEYFNVSGGDYTDN